MTLPFDRPLAICLLIASTLTGCGYLPRGGPLRNEVEPAKARALAGVQLVDVTDAVARQLQVTRAQRMFSETLGSAAPSAQTIGAGDIVEVSIWEAPPAALFGGGALDIRGSIAIQPTRTNSLPEQVVNHEGTITVPFAGRVRAAGRTPQALENEIADRLKGKANQPQVIVRVIRNFSSDVTVVGDVNTSNRMPMSARGERLLDAIAAAGGLRQPIHKMTIQVTRGNTVHTLPLDTIIRDPRQNIVLQSGDVIAALFQPLSFTALGATGKNEEVSFEATGISLAQALARSGGLQDNRSDPKGVFIFRFEQREALRWPREPVVATPEGLVPVVYRVDLTDASSLFVAQTFQVQNKDLIYVANAPSAELAKFMSLILSFAATYNVVTP